MADNPARKKVTLAWNGDDVARAMGTMFQHDGRAKYIDLPLSNYSTWPNDKVLKDGKMVGVSTFSGYSSNESSMLSLAMVDIDQSEPGTEVTLVWGEEDGGSAKPVVERHVQTEIRAIVAPAPYAEVVRASYRPQIGRARGRRAARPLLDGLRAGRGARRARVEPLRLGRPLREARRSASAGSGSGTRISSTCSRREASRRWSRSSTTTGCAISSSSSSWTGSSTRTTSAGGLRRGSRVAAPRPGSSSAPHQGRQHTRRAVPTLPADRAFAELCAEAQSTPTRRSSTSSCRST